jgi:hypothetical protein
MTCTPGIKAQGLKRVFNINIPICEAYSGALNTIASIADPVVIPTTLALLAGQALKQILAILQKKAEAKEFNPLPESSVSSVRRSRNPMMRFSVSLLVIAGG